MPIWGLQRWTKSELIQQSNGIFLQQDLAVQGLGPDGKELDTFGAPNFPGTGKRERSKRTKNHFEGMNWKGEKWRYKMCIGGSLNEIKELLQRVY